MMELVAMLVVELAAAQHHLTTKNLEEMGPHPQTRHPKTRILIKIRTKGERRKKKERIKNGLRL